MLHKLKTSLWTAIPTLANLSWWWVFAPVWVPVVFMLLCTVIGIILHRVLK